MCANGWIPGPFCDVLNVPGNKATLRPYTIAINYICLYAERVKNKSMEKNLGSSWETIYPWEIGLLMSFGML